MIARVGVIFVQVYLILYHGGECEAGSTGRLGLKSVNVTTATPSLDPGQLARYRYKTLIDDGSDSSPIDALPTTDALVEQSEEEKRGEKPMGNGPQMLFKVCGKSQIADDKTSGGKQSYQGPWPWTAFIYLEDEASSNPRCGGVLVSSQHILTAAHCVVEEVKNDCRAFKVMDHQLLAVSLSEDDGAHDGTTVSYSISVKKVLVHPYYNFTSQQHDIAIIILPVREDFGTSDHIQPICLPFGDFPTTEELSGKIMHVTGWEDEPFSDEVLEGKATVVSNKDCQKDITNRLISDGVMCARHENDSDDPCLKDSGGPLFLLHKRRYYVAGIGSDGGKCGSGVPEIYTRITSHMDWITMVISNLELDIERPSNTNSTVVS